MAADPTPAPLPLSAASVHVVVDMQVLFADHPEWGVPTARSILDGVRALASHRPDRTLWTRFVPAKNAAAAPGCWRAYFDKWPSATLDRGADVSILGELLPLVANNAVIDKAGYSAFENPLFLVRLRAMGADAVILTGMETDICVLSTALMAIDLGFFVVLAKDAMTSFDLEAHRQVLQTLLPRYAPQIRVANVSEILASWR